uniref:MFS transporter n=1 Tax=Puniceibacterium confluentis TaxID=1958944 RepID=UPI0035618A58
MTLSDTAETTPASGTSVGSNPDFRRYIVARFIWVMATQITNIAVGWLVYDVSQSALALGLVGLAAFAPRLVVVFVSGLVSDRFDRRLVICSCFAVNALAGLALMLVATSDPVPLGWVYVIFTFSGTARGFAGPAVQSLTPTLVSRDQLSRALSLTASVSQTAVIVGPALGGLLYTFGPIAPFSVAVMGFLVAIALLLTIAPRGSASGKAPVKLSDVFAGFVFIRRRPIILGAISL